VEFPPEGPRSPYDPSPAKVLQCLASNTDIVRILFVAILTLLVTVWAPAQPIGKTLPEFAFRTLDNQSVTLSQLRDQSPSGVLLMTFWCTECASCRATEESLAWLAKEYGRKIKVVAISSAKTDTADSVKAYLKEHGTQIDVLLDPTSEFARHLKVNTTTTTLILDQSGRMRYFGTLKRGRRFFALEPLKEILAGKIIGQPLGPIYG
jgi:thiol-disulfide isomerase/thioredoxin